MNKNPLAFESLDDEGFLTINVPDGHGALLPNIDSFCSLLNHESYPNSIINGEGAITDPNVEAFFVESAPNVLGMVFGQEFNPFIYRGQNRVYSEIIPTESRLKDKNNVIKPENRIKHCVDWVRKEEFLRRFRLTPYPHRCKKFRFFNCVFDFDEEAIAQHYGFMSNYVDITRELEVALFFAYTCKDGKDKDNKDKYKPIDDFNEYSPTLYIGNLAKIHEQYPGGLKLISFQVLPRPRVQKALAIRADNQHSIKELFTEYKLPKSYAIAQEVFKRQNRGSRLFPSNDYMGEVAAEIKDGNKLSSDCLKAYCNREKGCSYRKIKASLQDEGYEIVSPPQRSISLGNQYRVHQEIDSAIQRLQFGRASARLVSKPREVNFEPSMPIRAWIITKVLTKVAFHRVKSIFHGR